MGLWRVTCHVPGRPGSPSLVLRCRAPSTPPPRSPQGVADILVSKSRDWVVCFSVCGVGGWYGIVKFLPSLVVEARVARDVSRSKLVFLVHMCFKFVTQVGEVVV
eukprot:1161923-Pelagomonas_calceolata.AAC.6